MNKWVGIALSGILALGYGVDLVAAAQKENREVKTRSLITPKEFAKRIQKYNEYIDAGGTSCDSALSAPFSFSCGCEPPDPGYTLQKTCKVECGYCEWQCETETYTERCSFAQVGGGGCLCQGMPTCTQTVGCSEPKCEGSCYYIPIGGGFIEDVPCG